MKFSMQNFRSLLSRSGLTPSAVLPMAWWMLLAIFLALLALDGALFYAYGLGRAEMPVGIAEEGSFRVREETVQASARRMEARRAQFQAAPGIPSDLLNPFR